MSAVRYDLTFEEQSKFKQTFRRLAPDGSCKDVTGWGAQFEARHTRSSGSTQIVVGTVTGSYVSVTGSEGKFVVEIPEAKINDLKDEFPSDNTGRYDLIIYPNTGSPNTDPERLAQGRVRYSESPVVN